jgi:hypothetical protein
MITVTSRTRIAAATLRLPRIRRVNASWTGPSNNATEPATAKVRMK